MGARWVILMLPTTEDMFKPSAYSGLDDSVVARIALKPVSQLIEHVSETGSAVLDSCIHAYTLSSDRSYSKWADNCLGCLSSATGTTTVSIRLRTRD